MTRWAVLATTAVVLLVPTAAIAETTPTTTTTTPAPTGTTPAPTETTPGPTETTPTPAPPEYVERSIVVGTTAQGRTIRAYYKGWPEATTGPTLLVLGQMHGNEKAGKSTISWLRKNLRPKEGTAMWLIPTMNPDGDAKGRRVNSRGVDLNRNWPTTGWKGGRKGSGTWGGTKKGSEREVKAMMTFLSREKPDYVVSLHQPFGVVGKMNEDKAFEKRLSKNLGLTLKSLGVGTAKGKVSPTLTGWYNRYHDDDGVAITVEYRKKVASSWSGKHAGRAITAAALVR